MNMWKKHANELPNVAKILSDRDLSRKPSATAMQKAARNKETTDEASDEDDDDDTEDQLLLSSEDEGDMGGHKKAYTEADARALAKWIAMHPAWTNMTAVQRWDQFVAKVSGFIILERSSGVVLTMLFALCLYQYPSRTSVAWQEYYRLNKDGSYDFQVEALFASR